VGLYVRFRTAAFVRDFLVSEGFLQDGKAACAIVHDIQFLDRRRTSYQFHDALYNIVLPELEYYTSTWRGIGCNVLCTLQVKFCALILRGFIEFYRYYLNPGEEYIVDIVMQYFSRNILSHAESDPAVLGMHTAVFYSLIQGLLALFVARFTVKFTYVAIGELAMIGILLVAIGLIVSEIFYVTGPQLGFVCQILVAVGMVIFLYGLFRKIVLGEPAHSNRRIEKLIGQFDVELAVVPVWLRLWRRVDGDRGHHARGLDNN
jgi:hypothetical protein